MTFITKTLEIQEDYVALVNQTHLITKVKSPVFSTHESYRVFFQPKIVGQGDWSGSDSVIAFPIIPQYFHNFFEIFTKTLTLKIKNEPFKVVLVHTEEKQDGVFYSLIRNHPKATCNAAHLKEFFDWAGIEFICLTPQELEDSRFECAYLFYNATVYGLDRSNTHNDKVYELSHFLKVPYAYIVAQDIALLRTLFPKHPPKANNKIYISRKKASDRKYKFENEVSALLVSLGYREVFFEDMTFLEQLKEVQEASHIVCEYGSALVNCGLVSETTKVLSINHVEGYYVPTYHEIFNNFGINHTGLCLYGTASPVRALEGTLRASQDFYLN